MIILLSSTPQVDLETALARDVCRTIFDSAQLAPYHAPAMTNPLFDRVSPAELANREEPIEFKGEVGDLDRLSEIISADLVAVNELSRPKNWRSAPVEIRLAFSWLEGRAQVPVVEGHATATVAATCQRCLEAFEHHLDTPIRLLVGVKDGTVMDRSGLDEFEVWELSGDTVRAVDFVEESLIMAMPFAPVHESDESCKALHGPVENDTPDTIRPFADLRSKMGK